jgi:hypothetical protein
MKNPTQNIVIVALTLISAMILSVVVQLMNEPKQWQLDAIELQEQGFSKEASETIAKVENGVMKPNAFYNALIED